eukprot:1981093-Rhodomonas_salina.1
MALGPGTKTLRVSTGASGVVGIARRESECSWCALEGSTEISFPTGRWYGAKSSATARVLAFGHADTHISGTARSVSRYAHTTCTHRDHFDRNCTGESRAQYSLHVRLVAPYPRSVQRGLPAYAGHQLCVQPGSGKPARQYQPPYAPTSVSTTVLRTEAGDCEYQERRCTRGNMVLRYSATLRGSWGGTRREALEGVGDRVRRHLVPAHPQYQTAAVARMRVPESA